MKIGRACNKEVILEVKNQVLNMFDQKFSLVL